MNMDNSVLLQEINENLKCLRAIGESLVARSIEQNELLKQIATQNTPKTHVIEAAEGDLKAPEKIIAKATKTTTTKTVTKK